MFNETIQKYSGKNPVRFHMPGHKGKIPFSQTDITELFFTDNLYNPDDNTGFTEKLEKKIPEIFFPEKTDINSVISCGGATLLIQTVILYLVRQNNKSGEKYIICDRNSHISLVNALALCGVEPLWIFDEAEIEQIINANKDKNITGIFVTSPDYYGRMRDIKTISEIAHKNELPLTVDNSHGSHLAFFKYKSAYGIHPINNGADFSVDSMHKTLPVLTGGAVLHFRNIYLKQDIRSALRVFASTSPSFLILQSIENAIFHLEKTGKVEHKKLYNIIQKFRQSMEDLKIIPEYSGFYDEFRIILNAKNYDIKGKNLYFYLAENNIYCEFYDSENVIIIPSVLNSGKDFIILESELKKKFKNKTPVRSGSGPAEKINSNQRAMSLREAILSPSEKIPIKDSINRIAAESVAIYPPGVPIIVSGELINEETIKSIITSHEYITVTAEK